MLLTPAKQYKRMKGMPPLNDGTLTYEKSGHTLTFINGYYICSQKQKGKCNSEEEKNQKGRQMDERLHKAIMPFKIEENTGRDIFYELEKLEIDVIKSIEEEISQRMELLHATIKACEAEGKITQKDRRDLKNSLLLMQEIAFPRFAFFITKLTLKCLAELDESYENFRYVCPMFKKVYISDEGEVKAIELQGIDQWLFKYLQKEIPNYGKDLKIKVIDKLNLPDNYNLTEIIKYFRKNNYKDVVTWSAFVSKYSRNKEIDKMLKIINKEGFENQIAFWKRARDYIWQDMTFFYGVTYYD